MNNIKIRLLIIISSMLFMTTSCSGNLESYLMESTWFISVITNDGEDISRVFSSNQLFFERNKNCYIPIYSRRYSDVATNEDHYGKWYLDKENQIIRIEANNDFINGAFNFCFVYDEVYDRPALVLKSDNVLIKAVRTYRIGDNKSPEEYTCKDIQVPASKDLNSSLEQLQEMSIQNITEDSEDTLQTGWYHIASNWEPTEVIRKSKEYDMFFYIKSKPIVTNKDIEKLRLDKYKNEYYLLLQLNDRGKQIWLKGTTEAVGKYLGFIYNNELIYMPRVNDPIATGKVSIGGEGFDKETLLKIKSDIEKEMK